MAALFGFLLPLHGGLTVFFPELRFWKEFLLVGLICLVMYNEAKKIYYHCISQKKLHESELHSESFFKKYLKTWRNPEIFSIGLIIWILVLVVINPEIMRAAEAARYLLMLPLVYLIFFRLISSYYLSHSKTLNLKILKLSINYFYSFFLLSVLISITFGSWIKFGNDVFFVQKFYSNTISSWVPGQTIPIWHEIDGVIRMQGLSSGPVAFGHMCLLALGILPIWLEKMCHHEVDSGSSISVELRNKKKSTGVSLNWFQNLSSKYQNATGLVRYKKSYITFVQIISSLFLVWVIWQSGSRAALLGAFIVIIWQFFWQIQYCKPKFIRQAFLSVITLVIIGTSSILYFKPTLINNIVNRAGTSDHFTRPVQAFEKFIDSPVTGNIGELGPAARSWNLKHHNNDQALITENVFIDYLAQTGIIGFVFFMIFFFSAIYRSAHHWRGILLVFALTMSMATLLDMTPLAIALGIILALGHTEQKFSTKNGSCVRIHK